VLTTTFNKRPSTLAYMSRVLWPSPPLGRPPRVPELRYVWRNARIGVRDLAEFKALTGLEVDPLPALFPHVFGFRLLMALLTDRRNPLPIWNALQVRNRLTQHDRLDARDVLDIATQIAATHVLAKGLELDLHTTFTARGAAVWESVVTFYYRGVFGEPTTPVVDTTPPKVNGRDIAQWRAMAGQGRRFARLTGDYNGVHLSNGYARAFGFRGAFHHPQRVLGQALAHLPIDVARRAQQLDVWLRGQVYEGASVNLRGVGDDPMEFALHPQDDARPAIVARWSSGAA
jgi:hypothetical protein